MKTAIIAIAATVALSSAAPLFAQEPQGDTAKGYVSGAGGFANAGGDMTGNILFEAGTRIAPHVTLLGNVGRFGDLKAELQPTLDSTTASLATDEGLAVAAQGKVPTSYATAGVRVGIPTRGRVMPYVLGSFGIAHLNPSEDFTFASGTMPDGSTPDAGSDVTSTLTAAGTVTPPSSSNAPMFMVGGGVQLLTKSHWVVDAAYRYSRIAADSTLTTTPLVTNGMTFGFGYRF